MPAIARNGHIYGGAPTTPVDAEDIVYDNSTSELDSTNVQSAIDELKEIIDEGGGGGTDTTYTLSVGTGDDANKIILTPSTGSPDKVTVPYATSAGDSATVSNHTVATDVPANAVFTDTTYSDATTSASGLMSASDKTTINSLGTAAFRDIPTSGDASTSEVVLGADSRLSDARPASDVSSWAKASTKPTYTASEVGAIASTAKGANNGVAELDSTGKVPSSQLPSYVDDVLEYNSSSDFPLTGESGKIYIAKDTNKTYRWSGTTYTEISESLALGETSSTAFRGDHGKTAYDHASDANKLTTAQSSGLYKIGVTSEGHVSSATAVAKSDITSLGIPAQDTTYSAASNSGISLNSSTNEFSNSGVRSVTYGSTQGTISANTNGISADVCIEGIAYGRVGEISAIDDLYNVLGGYIEADVDQPFHLSHRGDKLSLFFYEGHIADTSGNEVYIRINNDTAQPVYYEGSPLVLSDDIYFKAGTTYTFTQGYCEAEHDWIWVLDDLHSDKAVNVSYDNYSSGMTADNVQDAIDEVNAKTDSLSDIVDGETKTIDYTSVITVDDAMPVNADVTAKIEPIQDLHGYDNPWVGGAGKNKLNVPNNTITDKGITYVVENTTVKISGTSTRNSYLTWISWSAISNTFFAPYAGQTIKMSSTSPNVRFTIAYRKNSSESASEYHAYDGEAELTLPSDTTYQIYIALRVLSNVTIDTIVYPMIRLASVQDSTWEPYTNICPISGWDACNIINYPLVNWLTPYENGVASLSYSDNVLSLYGNARYQNVTYRLPISNKGTQTMSIKAEKMASSSAGLVAVFDGNTEIYNSGEINNNSTLDFSFSTNSDFVSLMIFGTRAGTSDTSGMRYSNFVLNGKSIDGIGYVVSLNGTRYGGTLHIDNKGNAELLVNRAYVEFNGDGGEKWSITQTNMKQTSVLKSTAKYPATNNTVANIMCDKYKAITANNCYTGTIGVAIDVEGYLGINPGYSMTVAEWQAVLSNAPLQVVYELANPFTVSLSPAQIQLLKGQNNIYADSGDIKLTYETGLEESISDVQEQVNDVQSNFTDAIGWDNHKNLLPMSISELKRLNIAGTWNGNSYTYRDVTYTVNVDNYGSITSITVNGTASNTSDFTLPSFNMQQSFTLSGCPYGGSDSTYMIALWQNGSLVKTDVGEGNTIDAGAFDSTIRVRSGKTASNLTFYPMVRKASDTDPTFQPYHPVIGEAVNDLDNRVKSVEDDIGIIITSDKRYEYNIGEGGTVNITASNFNLVAPEGYVPIAFAKVTTGESDVVITNMNPRNTGNNTVLTLHNIDYEVSFNGVEAIVQVIYVKTSAIKQ